MNAILANYKLLIEKYQKTEKEVTENEIHDKRVILRKTFPILSVYKIKPSQIKNGEKAFKLFGKLRDIQVQLLKLQSIERAPDIEEYFVYLQERENFLKGKVMKFSENKKIKFPAIKKSSKVDRSKIYAKAKKLLDKIIENVRSEQIEDAENIHKIRIEYKKFRYVVEILSYIEKIEDSKLEQMKIYQDTLGEIQDYEVLIERISKFFEKHQILNDEIIAVFKSEQSVLIENFGKESEDFILFCRDLISFRQEEISLNLNEKTDILKH